jgi:MFS family permease
MLGVSDGDAQQAHLPHRSGDRVKDQSAGQAAHHGGPPAARPVGWGFIVLYTVAFLSTSLLFLAPLLVTLALKVNALVETERAPSSLSLVAGWCIAQLLFNAVLAALVAVLPDQVPAAQRGLVSGVLGVCTPVASVIATFLVALFTGNLLAMFLAPCGIGGFFILLFAVLLKDRRLTAADKPSWSLREFAATFYVDPRKSPDFAWAFTSRFLFVLAYAFLVTYQTYYLLAKLGSTEADVPQQIFLGTLVQSVLVVLASLVGGRVSDRTGRRKVFVLVASLVYGCALFVLAAATDVNGFLVGMAVSGLGFGVYVAVDLALVTQVLPDEDTVAKDLGVFNIAGALPFTIAPVIAPAILAIGGGSFGVLYTVAGCCAVLGAFAILPVTRVR